MDIRKYITKDLLILVIPLVVALIAYPFLPAHIPKLLHFFGVTTAYFSKEYIFFFALLPYAFYRIYQARRYEVRAVFTAGSDGRKNFSFMYISY